MTYLDPAETGGRLKGTVEWRVHRETVIVRGDLDPSGRPIDHWLVNAAVTEGQLVGVEPEGAAKQLVAETDAEERESLAENGLKQRDMGLGLRRVARSLE